MQLKIKLFGLLMLLSASVILAQESTTSPYSRFGYGIMNDKALSVGQAMGHTGIAIRPHNRINLVNPASLTSIDTMNFLFEVGAKSELVKYTLGNQSTNRSVSNVDYIAFGFPLTKWWGFGLSLSPFSKIGYQFKKNESFADSSTLETTYIGHGEFNQVLIGNSFKILPNLSVGVNVDYIFGQADFITTNILSDRLSYDSYIEKNVNLNGFLFSAGIQYSYSFNDRKDITFGAIFTPKQKLSYSQNRTVTAVPTDTTIYVSKESNDGLKSDYPMEIGGGISYNVKDKLIVTAETRYQDWSKATIFGDNATQYKATKSMNVGLEFLPDKYTLKGYHKRIRYRLGARYENSYTQARDNAGLYNPIDVYAVSVGLGLPMKHTANNVNLSCEYGKKNPQNKSLLSERFITFTFNFTLNEVWFHKRKIN